MGAICPWEMALQAGVREWARLNPERAAKLSTEEWEEVFSSFGVGGPLTAEGADHFVSVIERRRRMIEILHDLSGTHHMDVLEKIMLEMHEETQIGRAKYAERKPLPPLHE